MRLLVTGAGGQLGLTLRGVRRDGFELIPKARADLDITDAVAVTDALRQSAPDAIVNAAAYTAVDQAEIDAEAAYRGNEEGPRVLARAAAAAEIPFIHVSTDFVFDGVASRPYRPTDPTAPLNVYGASKLAGEKAVLDVHPAALIIRTSWLYRLGSRNFVTTILKLLREKGSVRVVSDQLGSPTNTESLAQLVVDAAFRMVGRAEAGPLAGIRHFADLGETSRYEFAVAIREEAVAAGLVEASATVEPIASDEPAGGVRRPAYSTLDSSQICAELDFRQLSWRDALARSFREDLAVLPR